MMPLWIAVAGRKGGVGKTTLAWALATRYAGAGRRVLLVDMDPQASASLAAGAAPGGACLAAVLEGSGVADPAAVGENLALLAGGPELEDMDGALPLRETIPATADVVIFDCPPGNASLDRLAIGAADVVLVCCEPHRLAIAGAARVLDEARAKRPPPRCALVLGRVDSRRGLDKAAPDLLAGAFNLPVLPIHQDAALAAALNAGSPPPAHGRAALDIGAVAAWVDRVPFDHKPETRTDKI